MADNYTTSQSGGSTQQCICNCNCATATGLTQNVAKTNASVNDITVDLKVLEEGLSALGKLTNLRYVKLAGRILSKANLYLAVIDAAHMLFTGLVLPLAKKQREANEELVQRANAVGLHSTFGGTKAPDLNSIEQAEQYQKNIKLKDQYSLKGTSAEYNSEFEAALLRESLKDNLWVMHSEKAQKMLEEAKKLQEEAALELPDEPSFAITAAQLKEMFKELGDRICECKGQVIAPVQEALKVAETQVVQAEQMTETAKELADSTASVKEAVADIKQAVETQSVQTQQLTEIVQNEASKTESPVTEPSAATAGVMSPQAAMVATEGAKVASQNVSDFVTQMVQAGASFALEGIPKKETPLADKITENGKKLTETLIANFTELHKGITGKFETLQDEALKKTKDEVSSFIENLFKGKLDKEAPSRLLDSLKDLGKGSLDSVKQMLVNWAGNQLETVKGWADEQLKVMIDWGKGKLGDFAKGAWEWLKNGLTSEEGFGEEGFFKGLLGQIKPLFSDLFSEIPELLKGAGGIFKDLFSGLFDGEDGLFGGIKNLFDGLFKKEGGLFGNIKNLFSGLFEGEDGLFGSIKNLFGDLFSGEDGLFGGIKNLFSNLFSGEGGLLSSLTGLLGGLFKGGGGLFSSIASFFGGFFAANGGVIPGRFLPVAAFAGGAPFIDRPTLGLVGEGRFPEAIVPLPDGRSIPVSMRGSGQNNNASNPVNFNVTIVAADARSFSDMARRNPQSIIAPFREALEGGDLGLINTIRGVM